MDSFLLTVKKAFWQITTEPILQTNSTLSNTSYHRFLCAKHAISLASIIQPETRHRSCMMAARSKHLHVIPEKIWCLCIRQQGNYPSLKEGGNPALIPRTLELSKDQNCQERLKHQVITSHHPRKYSKVPNRDAMVENFLTSFMSHEKTHLLVAEKRVLLISSFSWALTVENYSWVISTHWEHFPAAPWSLPCSCRIAQSPRWT